MTVSSLNTKNKFISMSKHFTDFLCSPVLHSSLLGMEREKVPPTDKGLVDLVSQHARILKELFEVKQ